MKSHDDLDFEPKHKKHNQAEASSESDEESKSDLVKAIGSIDVNLPSGELSKQIHRDITDKDMKEIQQTAWDTYKKEKYGEDNDTSEEPK